MLHLDSHTCLEPGARDHNEDNLRVGHAGSLSWAVLSDGAGGHESGDEASRRVVMIVDAWLERASRDGQLSPHKLVQAVEQAHRCLVERPPGQSDTPQGRGRMHATVVVLWLDRLQGQALWAHVGDSRLYRLQPDTVQAMTRDDSVVQQMVDAGFMTPAEAQRHPRKNQLLSALGTEDPVDVHVTPEPVPVNPGEAFLLCSDGWWEVISPELMFQLRHESVDSAEWIDRMARHIHAAARPQQDNFSAVGWWVTDQP